MLSTKLNILHSQYTLHPIAYSCSTRICPYSKYQSLFELCFEDLCLASFWFVVSKVDRSLFSISFIICDKG